MDTGRIRAEYPIDDEHKATHTNHCNDCAQRTPCDWSLAIAAIHDLADALDEAQTKLDMVGNLASRPGRLGC